MSENNYDIDEGVLTEKKEKVKVPRLFKVLLHNDDYTTMEFVVFVLKKVFFKNDTEATHIMLNVHKKGVGVAGVFSYEVAEMKVSRVHSFAESNKHPLKCSLEPE
ncbi:MAG: ATP-dependent Clp protease adapter ClpS [Thermodesulfobacteriota bacterium]